jgi:hypothetical protein
MANTDMRLIAATKILEAKTAELTAVIALGQHGKIEEARQACMAAYETSLDLTIENLTTLFRRHDGAST